MRLYPVQNAGFFRRTRRPINSDSPQLVGLELVIEDEARQRLGRGEKVNIVGWGEMFAASLTAIAASLRGFIERGDLTVLATNKEPFDLRSSDEDMARVWRKIRRNTDGLHPANLPDARTGTFIRENMGLLRWVGKAEASQLHLVLERERIGKATILHENIAALFHTSDGPAAARALSRAMDSGGLVFTTAHLHIKSAFGDIDDLGLEPVDMPGATGYNVYRKR